MEERLEQLTGEVLGLQLVVRALVVTLKANAQTKSLVTTLAEGVHQSVSETIAKLDGKPGAEEIADSLATMTGFLLRETDTIS